MTTLKSTRGATNAASRAAWLLIAAEKMCSCTACMPDSETGLGVNATVCQAGVQLTRRAMLHMDNSSLGLLCVGTHATCCQACSRKKEMGQCWAEPQGTLHLTANGFMPHLQGCQGTASQRHHAPPHSWRGPARARPQGPGGIVSRDERHGHGCTLLPRLPYSASMGSCS